MYSSRILRGILNYKINIVVKVLVCSDFLIFAGWNLFAPIFSIYILQKIGGASLETVGFASAIYMAVRSVAVIPVGYMIDRTRSEKDDLYCAILGTFLTGGVYLCYSFIDAVGQLYLLQCVLGVSAALAFPGWYKMFTRHLDKQKEGLEWSLYDVATGIGMALAAALGAFIAEQLGYDVLFHLVFVITASGSLLLLTIRKKIHLK